MSAFCFTGQARNIPDGFRKSCLLCVNCVPPIYASWLQEHSGDNKNGHKKAGSEEPA